VRADSDRHRERQRDNRNGQARHQVGAEIGEAVTFSEHRHQLRREKLGESGGSLWRGKGLGRDVSRADAAVSRRRAGEKNGGLIIKGRPINQAMPASLDTANAASWTCLA
jgi:hypothetical protein